MYSSHRDSLVGLAEARHFACPIMEAAAFPLRRPPDPRYNLRSRLDHLSQRLLEIFAGTRSHDEHGDGSRALFR